MRSFQHYILIKWLAAIGLRRHLGLQYQTTDCCIRDPDVADSTPGRVRPTGASWQSKCGAVTKTQALLGTDQELVRWRSCVNFINQNMGVAVGRMYVKQHFSPDSRENASTQAAASYLLTRIKYHYKHFSYIILRQLLTRDVNVVVLSSVLYSFIVYLTTFCYTKIPYNSRRNWQKCPSDSWAWQLRLLAETFLSFTYSSWVWYIRLL